MTFADILEPASVVVAHAELKGVQLGAGLATLLAPPLVSLRPALANPQGDPPLVAVAKCAGAGAVIGSVVVGAACLAKLASLDKDAVVQRADALRANEGEKKLACASLAGAGLGLSLVAVRFVKVAEAEGVAVGSVVCSRNGAWEAVCFAALGVAVCAGALGAGKAVAKQVSKAVEKGEEAEMLVKDAAGEAQAAVDSGAEEAKEAAEQISDKFSEVADGAKEAAEKESS